MRDLGADLVINYTTEDLLDPGRTAPMSSSISSVTPNFANSLAQVAPYGTVVSNWPVGNNLMAEYANIDIKFVNISLPQVSRHYQHRLRQAEILRRISEAVDQGQLRAYIDRIVDFAGIGAAQAVLEAGQTIGRVVLDVRR